jgi:hypothetical protein
MVQWPAKCDRCDNPIESWADAGLFGSGFLHKRCWRDLNAEAQAQGRTVAELRSPVERSSQLEVPMFISLMMFHFGLAAAVAGWFLLTQTNESRLAGVILLVVGLVVPLLGAAGAAINILSRRRIELIRHELDLAGGWKPGR